MVLGYRVMRNCGIQLFMVHNAVAILVNASLCLLYVWHNYITVVSSHQHYNICSTWFLDIGIYQVVFFLHLDGLKFGYARLKGQWMLASMRIDRRN